MPFFIRKFSKKDALALSQLIQNIFPESEGHFLPSDRIWVAQHTVGLIGFIRFSQEKDKLLLNGLGILPEFRSQRVGTMLLECALEALQYSQLPIYLKVKSLNPVIDLYTNFGFTLKKFGKNHVLVRKPKT